MTRNQIFVLVTGSCVLFATGCNIGMQPEGASVSDIQKIREKWTPEQQITDIQHSPMPASDKKRRIDEIKAKYHITSDTPKTEPGRPPGL